MSTIIINTKTCDISFETEQQLESERKRGSCYIAAEQLTKILLEEIWNTENVLNEFITLTRTISGQNVKKYQLDISSYV